LDDRQLANSSTLVLYTSDHGSMLYDHGVPDKHTLHTDALRVPLLVRWPAVISACSSA
jgi:arylsulfatase A-like enzyme